MKAYAAPPSVNFTKYRAMRLNGLGSVGSEMSKSRSDKVPAQLLDLFWPLAEGTEDARIKASNDILKLLRDLQGKVNHV